MTILVFVLLLVLSVPIAWVLLGTALAYIELSDNTVLFQSFPQQLFAGIEQYGLMAIPLFMLAGEIMNQGGLIRRLIGLAGILSLKRRKCHMCGFARSPMTIELPSSGSSVSCR